MDERAERVRNRRRAAKEKGSQADDESSETSEPSEHGEPSEMSEPSQTSKTSEPSQMSKTSEPSEPAQTSETSKRSGGSETSETNASGGRQPGGDAETADGGLKNEMEGLYMYLPEEKKSELDRQYRRLQGQYEFEYGDSLEKNRHWYPLIVEFGLQTLRDADHEDLHRMLSELKDS